MIKYYGFIEGKVYSGLQFQREKGREREKDRERETGGQGDGVREKERIKEGRAWQQAAGAER